MKHNKKKKNILKRILIIIALLFFMIGTGVSILLYGPFNGFRDWFVTVSMTSMTHQWIAKIFYTDDAIKEVMQNNRVEEIKEDTDTSSIDININKKWELKEEKKEETYENEYEKQLFAKNIDKQKYKIFADEEQYRVIRLTGNGYTGYLAAIYDPSKVKTMVTSNLGSNGEYLTTMSKKNNALVAVNGGRFYDSGGHGSGGEPRGITFSNGICKSTNPYNYTGGIIGFNADDILVLSSTTTKTNAQKLNIRDCVCSGPFLIVNGKTSKIYGNGGWGTNPRTAIGQRKDGVVLLLVLDGRLLGRPGANMDDIIEIMKNYGAYNAANLDGGTSTAMTVNGEVISVPVDASGTHRTRPIATAFGLIDK